LNATNHTHYEKQPGVAIIRLDIAPVDGFSHAVHKGLGEGMSAGGFFEMA